MDRQICLLLCTLSSGKSLPPFSVDVVLILRMVPSLDAKPGTLVHGRLRCCRMTVIIRNFIDAGMLKEVPAEMAVIEAESQSGEKEPGRKGQDYQC